MTEMQILITKPVQPKIAYAQYFFFYKGDAEVWNATEHQTRNS